MLCGCAIVPVREEGQLTSSTYYMIKETWTTHVLPAVSETTCIPIGTNVQKLKEDSFHQKIDLQLRKKPVKCYIWSTALNGTEAWTLREVPGENILEALKCGAGESWRRLVRPNVRHTKKDCKESRRKETLFRQ